MTTIHIDAIGAGSSSNSYVDVDIAGVCTTLLLDTKAQASVLNREALRRLPPRISLQQSTTRLKDTA